MKMVQVRRARHQAEKEDLIALCITVYERITNQRGIDRMTLHRLQKVVLKERRRILRLGKNK